MPTTTYTVASTADLNAALQAMEAIDTGGASSVPGTAHASGFESGFALRGQFDAINLASDDTLNSGGTYNGLLVYAGSVSNLSIADAKAQGGAGLGGSLVVAAGSMPAGPALRFDGSELA